ncbi:MAG: hypothetical protein ABI647_13660 [Gemmatimonadota bacterium]
MIRRWIAAVAAVMLVAGCSAKKAEPEAAATDTLTTRERQEALGRSGIPGARGVTKALDVADSARARAARLDTIGQR